jgi:hypothetical protein
MDDHNFPGRVRAQDVLSSASTLLGVALIVVTAVHVTGSSREVYADELAFSSAVLFLISVVISHRALTTASGRLEKAADYFFVAAIMLLMLGVLAFWF